MLTARPSSVEVVRSMIAVLGHRGPDSAGVAASGGHIAIGARRLAIVDVSRGVQPMTDEARGVSIVLDGEIYNHEAIRRDLEQRGHVFRTSCDTEVALRLYLEEGSQFLRRLRGMFALAIADRERLLVARDPMGIKPLYVARSERAFVFGSEIKALLQHPACSTDLDPIAFADRAVFDCPMGDRTPFAGIRSLAPGRWLLVERDGDRVHTSEGEHMLATPTEERLEHALDAAVRSHVKCEVPLAFATSGGLDSSMLALLARDATRERLRTFVVGEADDHPDVHYAQSLAGALDAEHTTVPMSLARYVDALPECVLVEEQPPIEGPEVHLLFRGVAQSAKVCIVGEGADELFGGYPFHAEPRATLERLRARIDTLRMNGIACSDRADEAIGGPWWSEDEALERVFAFRRAEPLVKNHLELIDKYALASGVEARVPYMDLGVVRVARALPLGPALEQKRILRDLFVARFAGDVRAGAIVSGIAARRKLGMPSAALRAGQAFERACERLVSDDHFATHEWRRFLAGKRDLVVFEIFRRLLVDERGRQDRIDAERRALDLVAAAADTTNERVRAEIAA